MNRSTESGYGPIGKPKASRLATRFAPAEAIPLPRTQRFEPDEVSGTTDI